MSTTVPGETEPRINYGSTLYLFVVGNIETEDFYITKTTCFKFKHGG
jgi:hypothetical protein